MCGIVGDTNGNRAGVERASSTLTHRGPDQSDMIVNDQVVFGHQRLSIIDVSIAGKQPMIVGNGECCITYNGEIYNYKELRSYLEGTGSIFKTNTDTEVIVEGYRFEGVEFFKKMRGMWAFAIHDRKKKVIVLSRDQLGIKPLYYTQLAGGLTFASEMKALRSFNIPFEPNTGEFYVFFNLGYFITPQTCFKDVFTLQPGKILTYNLDEKAASLSKNCMFEQKENCLTGSIKTYDEKSIVESLNEVLLDSVHAHYVSDVPVGLLFSGGNESALLAALSKHAGYSPKAYHLAIEGSTDTAYAKRIAKYLQLDVEIITMTERDLEMQYAEMWNILDVPYGDLSIITTMLIFKKINGRSKVVLCGEGGDELFGGYRRHQQIAHMGKMRKNNEILALVYSLIKASGTVETKSHILLQRLRRLFLLHGTDDVIGMYLRQIKLIDFPFDHKKIRSKLYDIFENQNGNTQPTNLFFDRQLYIQDNLLYKDDVSSMAQSIEARVPFVDTKVFEYIIKKIPSNMCLSSQYTNKYLLKKVMEKYLPKDLIHRDKMGFMFSFKKYQLPQFREDVKNAILFHYTNADMFGLRAHRSLLNTQNTSTFIDKYPRFAFALVSNWKIFR